MSNISSLPASETGIRRRRDHGSAYRHLEEYILDIDRLIEITDKLVGRVLEEPQDERQRELLNTMIIVLREKGVQLRKTYLDWYDNPPLD